jgi:hypothetical protein
MKSPRRLSIRIIPWASKNMNFAVFKYSISKLQNYTLNIVINY